MASPRIYNVLFLCTGNSARSIMAECSLNRWGRSRFRAFSAGSRPRGEVHPITLEILRKLNFTTDGLRSKSWDEFARPASPPLDFVFTVCDQAAGETCPVWPGQPMTAPWGIEDPAAFVGAPEAQLRVFQRAYIELDNRIRIFTSLRLEELDKLTLQRRLDEIGGVRLPSAEAARAPHGQRSRPTMCTMVHRAVAVVAVMALTACATPPAVSKPGFYTEIRDGRLWVFRQGSRDIEDFKKHGEPVKQVTRIGAGPNGMTIRSSDAAVIDEYLAAK